MLKLFNSLNWSLKCEYSIINVFKQRDEDAGNQLISITTTINMFYIFLIHIRSFDFCLFNFRFFGCIFIAFMLKRFWQYFVWVFFIRRHTKINFCVYCGWACELYKFVRNENKKWGENKTFLLREKNESFFVSKWNNSFSIENPSPKMTSLSTFIITHICLM